MKNTWMIVLLALVAGPSALGAAASIGDPKILTLSGLNATAGVSYSSTYGYYVTDNTNNVVQHYDPSGNLLATFSGSFVNGASAAFANPAGVQVDAAGNLWLANAAGNQVLEMNASGTQLAALGSGTGAAALSSPSDLALGSYGAVYVADSGNNRVAVYDSTTLALLFSFGNSGMRGDPSLLSYPTGICVSGNHVYVADSGNARVAVYDLHGSYQFSVGSAGSGPSGFNNPVAVAVDTQGRLWVADQANANVQIFSANGAFIAGVGNGFDAMTFTDLSALTVEANGNMLAANGSAGNFYLWDASVSGMGGAVKADASLADVSLKVGPVPARAGEALQLILPSPADKITWQIYTADMRLAGETEASNQSHVVYAQTADLAAGVYIVKLTMDDNGAERQSLQKIVITR